LHLKVGDFCVLTKGSTLPQHLEAACARAIYYGDLRYRRIRDILNAALDREPLPEAPSTTEQLTFVFARSATEFFTPVPEVVA